MDQAQRFHAIYKIGDKTYRYTIKSLFCLGPKNGLRVLLVHIMVNKWFDRFITLCIILNSLLLASKEYEMNYDT